MSVEVARLKLKDAVELRCDICEAWIGYVFEKDLSGSYFFCGDCISEGRFNE